MEVITTLIASAFTNAEDEYVEDVAPAIFTPPFCHWYVGVVPPLLGVAVNVTFVPAQMAPAGDATIVTLAGKFGFTIIVIVFDVAGLPVKHGVAFDVMITLIASVFTNALEEYVEAVAPAIFTPPFCH